MILIPDIGGYVRDKIYLEGSFRVNGTSAPDDIRDGNSNLIASVGRDSAGLFTITFATPDNGGLTAYPEKLVHKHVTIDRAAAPTQPGEVHFVVDSYDQATHLFQIAFTGPLDAAGADSDAAPTAKDPDDDDVINFLLVGSICSSGTD